ncbi:TPA: flagellar hook-basal body complex protein FliE [Candidatus Poribacteria bacterium]|nr:flagellar hook-basal body complex protein FliE [Candidatus Poribacteria bacterium]
MRVESSHDRLKFEGQMRETASEGKGKASSSFVDILRDSIRRVNELQIEADKAIAELATGKNRDIARTMIAVEKANIAFQMMTQIRNKIVEAYQEIMRMQV